MGGWAAALQVIEPWNHSGWERPQRPPNPTIKGQRMCPLGLLWSQFGGYDQVWRGALNGSGDLVADGESSRAFREEKLIDFRGKRPKNQ